MHCIIRYFSYHSEFLSLSRYLLAPSFYENGLWQSSCTPSFSFLQGMAAVNISVDMAMTIMKTMITMKALWTFPFTTFMIILILMVPTMTSSNMTHTTLGVGAIAIHKPNIQKFILDICFTIVQWLLWPFMNISWSNKVCLIICKLFPFLYQNHCVCFQVFNLYLSEFISWDCGRNYSSFHCSTLECILHLFKSSCYSIVFLIYSYITAAFW